MGISLDYGRARSVFLAAIEWAESGRPVPTEWVDRTARVAALESRTYTPMLATALLARATDDRVDALSLKVESGDAAYSARTLCHNVLVPASVTHGFSLRTTGREPLNNQPFFARSGQLGGARAEPGVARLPCCCLAQCELE